MCGIAGLYRPEADLPAEALEVSAARMAGALRHRGPDGGGTWCDPTAGIALGHRRLAIIDRSPAGSQPMTSRSGRWVLTLNGEIYNFRGLRAELRSLGHGFRGHSDTEALLAGVEQWGLQGALRRAVGMFALGLWDRQERVLHLARDRMGEKPLYCGWVGGAFLFGSELKALRAHDGWRGDIDRASVQLLLRCNFIPGPRSIYNGVSKLPPGAILSVDAAGHPQQHLFRYWSFEQSARQACAERFPGSEAEASARLEALLQSIVKDQSAADVPVGAFLSGGIDSSTVAAIMQSRSAQPIRTFTMGFDAPSHDEAGYARAVARHLGTDHTEMRLASRDLASIVPQLPMLYDEPFADASQIPTLLLARLAREKISVALTGDGADELFGGYNRHVLACELWRRTGWLPAAFRAFGAHVLTRCPPAMWERVLSLGMHRFPRLAMLRPAADRIPKLADIARARSLEDLYDRLVCHWQRPPIVDPLEETGSPQGMNEWRDLANPAERMMAADTIQYLPDDILVKVDRAGMAASLEPRCPFLDHRLVELAWHLPPSLKIRNGQGKALLRQVLRRYVPETLTERPKTGFGVPLDAWLRGPLRDWAEALLDPAGLRAQGYLDPAPIRRCWEEHLRGGRNWQYRLWGVLMFQAWLEHERRAVRPESPAPALLTRQQRFAAGAEVPHALPAGSAQAAARGRLLFLVNDARFFLSHRLPLALAARAKGFEVSVAAPNGPGAQDIVAHGLRFHPVPMNRWSSHPWRELRTFLHIAKLLKALRPDMLHAVTIKPVLYGCLAARLIGIRSVVAAIPGMSQIFVRRGWWAALRRCLVRFGYRQAFGQPNVRVIFQNPDDLRELVRAGIVDSANAMLIRGSGVDLKRFAPTPLPPAIPLVVLVSRMLTTKGVAEFVAAARELQAKGIRARFALIGDTEDGNPSAVPRRQLEAWQAAGTVEWWGHRDDVPEVMAQAYLVCLPSYREGLPKVLLEAAAAGRPLIATDVPGCREVVREGENGLLVGTADSRQIAAAIDELLRDPVRARAMGNRSRALAEREFGIAKVVRRTLAVYDALLPAPVTIKGPLRFPAVAAAPPNRALDSVGPAEELDGPREVVTLP